MTNNNNLDFSGGTIGSHPILKINVIVKVAIRFNYCDDVLNKTTVYV